VQSCGGTKAGMSPSEARFFLAVFAVEDRLDLAASGRDRSDTAVVRWRTDKLPDQCTMDQLEQKTSRALVRNILRR
jgi:hypothetical protein